MCLHFGSNSVLFESLKTGFFGQPQQLQLEGPNKDPNMARYYPAPKRAAAILPSIPRIPKTTRHDYAIDFFEIIFGCRFSTYPTNIQPDFFMPGRGFLELLLLTCMYLHYQYISPPDQLSPTFLVLWSED